MCRARSGALREEIEYGEFHTFEEGRVFKCVPGDGGHRGSSADLYGLHTGTGAFHDDDFYDVDNHGADDHDVDFNQHHEHHEYDVDHNHVDDDFYDVDHNLYHHNDGPAG